jgi:hypothetical protein
MDARSTSKFPSSSRMYGEVTSKRGGPVVVLRSSPCRNSRSGRAQVEVIARILSRPSAKSASRRKTIESSRQDRGIPSRVQRLRGRNMRESRNADAEHAV